MGIEFRLGRSDHKVAEDFVVHRPAGVDGVWLDAHNVRFQSGVVETAKAAGIEVLVEPLTERLVAEGFAPSGLPYAVDGPVDLVSLAVNSLDKCYNAIWQGPVDRKRCSN